MMDKIIFIALSFIFMTTLSHGQEDYKEIVNENKQYTADHQYDVPDLKDIKLKRKPKNVILMIGDGMGHNQVFAAYTANGGKLNLQNCTHMGLVKTKPAKKFTTDSAAAGTALACGKKTSNGAVGVDADSNKLVNIREELELMGKATGVVSTSSITHATPASFVAHQNKRNMYEAIANDFAESNIDVFIGGGKKHFVDRKDSVNLLNKLEAKGYQVLEDINEIAEVTEGKLVGLTSWEHNKSVLDGRGEKLSKASKTAMTILDGDKDGFFLMIEGSQIDWAGHQNNTSYLVTEMLDFDKAIGEVLAFAAQDRETLVIITADHETGGFGIKDGSYSEGKVEGMFPTKGHTGIFVPLFAYGPGAEEFNGILDNTDIPNLIAELFGTQLNDETK